MADDVTTVHLKDGTTLHLKGQGLSPEQVTEKVSAFRASQAPQEAPTQAQPAAAGAPEMRAQPKDLVSRLKQMKVGAEESLADALPGAGATVGGIAGASAGGPVGAVGGAGIGGMGGAAAKQLLYRLFGFGGPKTSSEAAGQIMKEGAVQGGLQAGSEGLGALSGPLAKTAETQYERALAPTTKINKNITKDITPQLIKRGETGSLGSLEKKAGEKISTLGPQLDKSYAQAPTPIKGAGTKVIADLDTLKATYMPGGKVAQPQAVKAIEGVQDIVRQYGADVDPTTLRRVRQIFEEVPAARGAYAGVDLSTNYTLNAQDQAANSIRGILNSSPNIGKLNKEISFWLDVQKVTRDSGLRQTGQSGGLAKVLTPLAAGAAATTTGVKFGATAGIEAGVGTALATMAYQAVRSPLWRTTSAVAKNRLAQLIANGDVRNAGLLITRLGLAAATPPPQQQQQTSSPLP